MNKNNKRKIIIALVLVVGMLVASIFGMDAFAEEIKIENVKEYNGRGNTNLPEYRHYDLAFSDVVGIENSRNLTMEIGMNGFAITNGENISTIHFKDKVDVYTEIYEEDGVRREPRQLMEIVFDKTEGKIIPIYYPENSYLQAFVISYSNAFADNINKTEEIQKKFDISNYERFCLMDAVCKGFNGIEKNERLLFDIMLKDWQNDVDYDTLKEVYGIDDNYIKYVLENYPK